MKLLAFTMLTLAFHKDYLIYSLPSPQKVDITGPVLEMKTNQNKTLIPENGAAGHGGS